MIGLWRRLEGEVERGFGRTVLFDTLLAEDGRITPPRVLWFYEFVVR